MDAEDLDETMKISSFDTADELLKARSTDIAILKQDLAKLQVAGATISELRHAVSEGKRLQSELTSSGITISKETLVQAGIPIEDLEEAKQMVIAVSVVEGALEKARTQLTAQGSSPTILDDLKTMLKSWRQLRSIAEATPRRLQVDLQMSRRQTAVKPLIDALFDRAVDLKAASKRRGGADSPSALHFDQQLKALVSEEWVIKMLNDMEVEVPLSDIFGELSIPPPVPGSGSPVQTDGQVYSMDTGYLGGVGGSVATEAELGTQKVSAAGAGPKTAERVFAMSTGYLNGVTGTVGTTKEPSLGSPELSSRQESAKHTSRPGSSVNSQKAASTASNSPKGSSPKAFAGPGSPASTASNNSPSQQPVATTLLDGKFEKVQGQQSSTPFASLPTFANMPSTQVSSATASATVKSNGSVKSDGSSKTIGSAKSQGSKKSSNGDNVNYTFGIDGMKMVQEQRAAAAAAKKEGKYGVDLDKTMDLDSSSRLSDLYGVAANMASASKADPVAKAAAQQNPFAIGKGAPQEWQQKREQEQLQREQETNRLHQQRQEQEQREQGLQQELQRKIAAQSQQQQIDQQQRRSVGSQELWQAVHVGDKRAVVAELQRSTGNGKTRDASGHSVLWHAIAFCHIGLATYMLEAFPPGSDGGVDLTEVHPRRGDTIFHLLCACKPFGPDTAALFRSIAGHVPPSLLKASNAAGQSFAQIAAASLNFWILRFLCVNYPDVMQALALNEQQAPLRGLSDIISKPWPPSAAHPQEPLPGHFAIAAMLSQDASGRVPFADVAFDVGPEEDPVDGFDEEQKGRFLAHKVVVAAQSQVLLTSLSESPVERLEQEGIDAVVFRVDHRISKGVWRSVLQFLYTGVIHCPFQGEPGAMVQMFRACIAYTLPRALLDFSQSTLFAMLPQCPPHFALEVFSICQVVAADPSQRKSPEFKAMRPMLDAATFILLRSAPTAFKSMDSKEASAIMEKMVQTIEYGVFNPIEEQTRYHQQAEQQQQIQALAASAEKQLLQVQQNRRQNGATSQVELEQQAQMQQMQLLQQQLQQHQAQQAVPNGHGIHQDDYEQQFLASRPEAAAPQQLGPPGHGPPISGRQQMPQMQIGPGGQAMHAKGYAKGANPQMNPEMAAYLAAQKAQGYKGKGKFESDPALQVALLGRGGPLEADGGQWRPEDRPPGRESTGLMSMFGL